MTRAIDRDELERALRGIVSAGSDVAGQFVRRGNDRATRPNNLYATLLLIVSEQNGNQWQRYSSISDSDIELKRDNVIDVSNTYSLQFYHEGAMDAIQKFRNYIQSLDGITALQAERLTLGKVGLVNQLDVPINNTMEERAVMDIQFKFTQQVATNVNIIETIPFTVADSELT